MLRNDRSLNLDSLLVFRDSMFHENNFKTFRNPPVLFAVAKFFGRSLLFVFRVGLCFFFCLQVYTYFPNWARAQVGQARAQELKATKLEQLGTSEPFIGLCVTNTMQCSTMR